MKKILFFILFSQLFFSQQWSISFAERASLLNIYNSTDGENWSQTWDQDKDPKTWYGIKIKNGTVIEINLRGNLLKGNFPVISGFPNLNKLDLSSNQLTGPVSPSISSITNLQRLDISNNRLNGDPTAAISPLFSLSEISLGNNQFIFGDIETFLQNFPKVEILDLSKIGLIGIPAKIASLTKLTSLNLSNNSISQNFNNLTPLISLQELNLSGNKLTKIPTEISSLSDLKILEVSNNLFSTNYATVLANLPKLEWLSLKTNQITTFPTELLQLKNLIHLNISDNQISGGFDHLLALNNLEQIFLDNNLITGDFPSILLKLTKIQMISITGNQLSGEIPPRIPAITFLDNNRYSKVEIKDLLSKTKNLTDFTYSPQRYDELKTVAVPLSESVSLTQSILGNEYQFTWFKNLDQKTPVNSGTYFINSTEEEDYTTYTCEAYTFEQLPDTLLEISFFREPITLAKNLYLSEDEIIRDIIVYPNPSKDFIHIKSTKIQVEQVFIIDLSGKIVYKGKSKTINIQNLPTATYIISVQTPVGLKSFKFIKN